MKKKSVLKAILISSSCLLVSLIGYCAWAFYKIEKIQEELYIND